MIYVTRPLPPAMGTALYNVAEDLGQHAATQSVGGAENPGVSVLFTLHSHRHVFVRVHSHFQPL